MAQNSNKSGPSETSNTEEDPKIIELSNRGVLYVIDMNELYESRIPIIQVMNSGKIDQETLNTYIDLTKKIIKLLDNRNSFEEMGYQSRLFVEQNHEATYVANRFVDTWNGK